MFKSPSSQPIVSLENVAVQYAGSEPVFAGVDLKIDAGKILYLTGASGAGKTSFLRLLYLAQTPNKGRLSLFGRPVMAEKRKETALVRRKIGVVSQDLALLNHLDVFENISLPLRIAGQKPKQYASDVKELINWVGLGHRIKAKPPTMSGGEQQRVAIARAIVNKPKLLLADEPTGNVDQGMGHRLMHLFQELNKSLGMTIIIATHDLELIERFPSDVITLKNGVLTHQGKFLALPSPADVDLDTDGDADGDAQAPDNGAA